MDMASHVLVRVERIMANKTEQVGCVDKTVGSCFTWCSDDVSISTKIENFLKLPVFLVISSISKTTAPSSPL